MCWNRSILPEAAEWSSLSSGRGLGEGERHSNLGFTHLTQDLSGRITKLTAEHEHRRVTRTSEDPARSGTEKLPVGGFDARRKICAARAGKGSARKVIGCRDARPGVGFLRSSPALSRSGRGFENRPWIVLPPQRNLGRNPPLGVPPLGGSGHTSHRAA